MEICTGLCKWAACMNNSNRNQMKLTREQYAYSSSFMQMLTFAAWNEINRSSKEKKKEDFDRSLMQIAADEPSKRHRFKRPIQLFKYQILFRWKIQQETNQPMNSMPIGCNLCKCRPGPGPKWTRQKQTEWRRRRRRRWQHRRPPPPLPLRPKFNPIKHGGKKIII